MHSSIWGRDRVRGHGHTQSQGGRTEAEWKQMGNINWSPALKPCCYVIQQKDNDQSQCPRTWCSSLNGCETSIVQSNNTNELGDPWLLKVKRAEGTRSTSTPVLAFLSGCITRHIQPLANYFTRFPGVTVTVDMATILRKARKQNRNTKTKMEMKRTQQGRREKVGLKSQEAKKEVTNVRTNRNCEGNKKWKETWKIWRTERERVRVCGRKQERLKISTLDMPHFSLGLRKDC